MHLLASNPVNVLIHGVTSTMSRHQCNCNQHVLTTFITFTSEVWFTQRYLCFTGKDRATPNLADFPQSSTAVTHCFLVAAHFNNPERIGACVKLESAA